ncbi:c-type cytochrome [Acidobacteria bacterium AH-259-A15]|nr:c-type cytochrome [Acidobacteria bacterium AH-259-A15]
MRKLVPSLLLFSAFCLFAVGRLASQQHPGESVRDLRVARGLQLTLWASEPDVINPTNMDIDERGRIWITEAVNYRRRLFKQPDYREEGDRITILEDTDGDGKADKFKIFVQDASLRSPLGIAVLGNKVLVSQSPDIIAYTKDEDDNVVKREVFLTGWRGEDHDHGVHAVVYGPDGYYYFNNGDRGLDVTDRSGRRIVSGPNEKYYAGTALRVRPDGTGLEVIGHNFRNPYELAIDSFGNIWQSDNDDDGNEWTRINYVMKGGNHGYWGPGGKRWQEDRGTHFHQEDPGVVPTLLRTGAGSPCGIVAYAGKLFPKRYWGKLLHVDNGPRVLRLYDVRPDGAGFKISMQTIVDGSDTWFRPSDLVVAHDGSVFIADWYDAVVGGHQMKDIERGRIYRLTPTGHKTRRTNIDLSTPQGRVEALSSPAQSVRYLAHVRYLAMGAAALPELTEILERDDPLPRARALWLLGAIGPRGLERVGAETRSADPKFRVLAVRILKQNHSDFVSVIRPLLHDPSPQVRREIAIGLRDVPAAQAHQPLVELARQFDGMDRWYLEALAIGARGKENLIYDDLREVFPGPWDSRLGKLLWVLRPSKAIDFLKTAAQDKSLSARDRIQALETLGVHPSPEVGHFLANLVVSSQPLEVRAKAAERLIKQLFSLWTELRKSAGIAPAIREALAIPATRMKALNLIGDLGDPQYSEDLFKLVDSSLLSLEVRAMAIEVAGKLKDSGNIPRFQNLLDTGPTEMKVAAVRALGSLEDAPSRKPLQELILSRAPNEVRSEAVRALGRSTAGLNLLLDLAKTNQLPSELRSSAIIAVNRSRRPEIQKRAKEILPMFTTRNRELMQRPRAFLLRVQGRVEEGREVFFGQGQCSSCHNVGGGPQKIGPDLGTIGDKLGKEGLFEAIVNPSGGIAPEYVTWIVKTRSAGKVRGMIVADTAEQVSIRDLSGNRRTFVKSDILERKRDPVSAMPNLIGVLTEQETADVIAYMESLKASFR